MSNHYGVIYADPPWVFEAWSRETGQGRSAASHYPTMSYDDLARLPVSDLASDNCVLLMWSTWPTLPEALKLGAAWGFEYKTLGFDWLKRSPSGRHWHMGLGYWSRANSEPCLLFTRGAPKRKSRGVRQLIVDVGQQSLWPPLIAPVGRHSAKPHEAYRRIEALLNGPYLELFARNSAPGWDCWGLEAPNGIEWNYKGEIMLPQIIEENRRLDTIRDLKDALDTIRNLLDGCQGFDDIYHPVGCAFMFANKALGLPDAFDYDARESLAPNDNPPF